MQTQVQEGPQLGQFEKAVDWACRKLDVVSGLALVAMMLLIACNVILRQVWEPIEGTYEFTAFLASMTVAFAIANCARKKGHIALTLFVDSLPPRAQAFFDIIVYLLGTTLYTVLSWQVAKYAYLVSTTGEVSPTTEVPFYPFIYGVSFGLIMLALVLLVDLIKSVIRIFK